MKAIIDCNNFYCSCERLFKPWLKNIPVVVLSNNDGCIISRSDEAKKLGLKMAAPYFMVKPFLEKQGVQVFSSNYALYGDLSKRVMETIASILPENCIEVYSVDEAFLDLSNVSPIELNDVVKNIKDTVELWTGIAVSIGVAPTKTLSKIANHLAKTNKEKSNCLLVLDTPDKIAAALKRTPVDEIWGIGKQFAAKIEKLNVKTGYELQLMPEEWFRKNLGGVVGVRLLHELQGSPSIGIDEQLSTKKMVSCTRRFERPLTDLKFIKEAVATYVSRAAEKLRRQQSAVKTLSVFIIPKEFKRGKVYKPLEPVTTQMKLPVATSRTNELIKQALILVEQIFKEGATYEKAGVIFSDLTPDSSLQGNFFSPQAGFGQRYLMSQVDNVNFSMRNEKVKFASAGVAKPWKMKQEFLSSGYTTRWNELRLIS
ncbi:Y-family DNA polymerase [Segetibacter koreensis]|uniref:Y-family DNA polymerase n=1 Tax=Segetibacter koreensis TaxID=398037 RepID=UPI0004780D9A|nr:Y-family DNA polymerase [Segetibacter koreensis]